MARFERNFSANADAPLSLDGLLAMLGGSEGSRSREGAIACYLSASEGWREAAKRLGGAFADEATGLKDGKAG